MQKKLLALAMAGALATSSMPVMPQASGCSYGDRGAPPSKKGAANRRAKRKAQKVARRKNRK